MKRLISILLLLPFSALAQTPPTVLLSWTASVSGGTVNVYRGSACGGTFLKITSGVNGTAYTDTLVLRGATYAYQVTAVVGGAESAPSNCITVTVPNTISPSPPTALTATPGS